MVPFSLPLQGARGDFSLVFTVGSQWSSWRIISQYCGSPYDWVPLEFLTLRVVLTESPALITQGSGFPTRTLAPEAVSAPESLLWEAATPCIHLPASPVLGAAVFPVLPSCTDPRRVNFSVCFTCCQDRVATFKLITCGTRKQKSLIHS